MTLTFKLEQADGTPCRAPSIESAALSWRPGHTIPLGPNRTLLPPFLAVQPDCIAGGPGCASRACSNPHSNADISARCACSSASNSRGKLGF
jgi:hypothetical protein